MRKGAVIAALWSCVALAQGASSVSLLDDGDDTAFRSAGTPAPLFSFASPTAFAGYAAYSGLPAADGCYAPASVTGTKGEALTFTRATTRFCPTDGTANEATGVMCASGEVCITSSGTTRGISIFRAGTNSCLRSQEFNDAVWASNNSGVAAPTVTANASVAPDGTTTADRIQIPAVTGAQYSQLYQLSACPAGTQNASVWVKGNGASGDFHLKLGTACAICAYTNGVWTRCAPGIAAAGSLTLAIANDGTSSCGANDAVDAFIWGAQCESGTYATPYVATTSASATRNAETATFPITWSGNTVSTAATLANRKATAAIGIVSMHSSFPAGGPNFLSYVTGGGLMSLYSASAEHAQFDPSPYFTTSDRTASYCTGAASGNIWNGNTTTGADCGSLGSNSVVAIGWFTAATQADSIVSNVCLDSSPTRCR